MLGQQGDRKIVKCGVSQRSVRLQGRMCRAKASFLLHRRGRGKVVLAASCHDDEILAFKPSKRRHVHVYASPDHLVANLCTTNHSDTYILLRPRWEDWISEILLKAVAQSLALLEEALQVLSLRDDNEAHQDKAIKR